MATAFRYPLPYAFARSHQLLLEDDGEHSTLWHGPAPDASACGEVMRRHTVTALQGRGMSRPEALAEMLRLYCERMHANEPVHTWDLPG